MENSRIQVLIRKNWINSIGSIIDVEESQQDPRKNPFGTKRY